MSTHMHKSTTKYVNVCVLDKTSFSPIEWKVQEQRFLSFLLQKRVLASNRPHKYMLSE